MSNAGTVLELEYPSLASLALTELAPYCVFKTTFIRLCETATEREQCLSWHSMTGPALRLIM
jgi:hypothetical protein